MTSLDAMPYEKTVLVNDPHAWDGVRQALQSMQARQPERLLYVPNEGNAGDALIAAGTWQFFDDLGLKPRYARVREIRRGDALVYAGGGNLVPEYESASRFLERCLEVGVSSVIVLPHTIRGHEALLKRLDERFTLVCRDQASIARVQATGTGAQVLYAPDMALYIDVPRLFERCASYRGPALWARMAHHDRLVPYLRWRLALALRQPPEHLHLDVIRVDAEAIAALPGDKRWDMSNLYGSKFRLREESDLVSRDFLRFFGQLVAVRTNRLHAGVAAALMGCEVTYLDNSYGKIGAVYDAWMSHLPQVNFLHTPPPAGLGPAGVERPLAQGATA
ncbi:polysaccharide pyruvyl transferase family protein [Piscinibacter sp. HJYY11]|uniref:polysaccharide pyruvyl transferase family protein n=1 Tax=Piscinibacter sp. HJYY11 TaxID=2801333 RepID=UPI00191F4D4F|nr:polysaccharide pyruvyl transferase family protein [Piscinibacter sp. HJYY11]MBL0730697.1 polysaccharide pyruvyl transferase family protein [Piscinibacter sp. HJYY11]